jgi:hypothetical protein
VTRTAPDALRQKRRYLQLHRRIFAGTALIALLTAIAVEDSGRFVWPFLVWGFVLFLHFLYVRSLDADDAWASNRAADVSQHAYDSGHIDIIRKRYEDDTPDGQSGGAKNP